MELLISSTGCVHDLTMLGYGRAFLPGEFDAATAGRRPPKMDKTQDTIDKENWGLIKRTLNESFKPLVLGATPVASRLSIVYDFVKSRYDSD